MDTQATTEEIKSLLEQWRQTGAESVEKTAASVRIMAEIGQRVQALKKELGKEWVTWRERNLSEITDYERGAVRLAKIQDRQPELFADPAAYVKLGKAAGVIPSIAPARKGPSKTVSALIVLALGRALRLLEATRLDEHQQWGRAQIVDALRKLVDWVRREAPEALDEADPGGSEAPPGKESL